VTALPKLARVYWWTASEGTGLEECRLDTDPVDDCYVAHGNVLGIERDGLRRGRPFRLTYKVKADSNWHTRKVTLEARSADGATVTRILRGDGRGNWKDSRGDILEPAKGCLDIDIWATPLTNTLPIRRLGVKSGGTRQTIRALWVTGPDLQLRTVAQHYSVLPGGRVLFEDGDSSFRAELALDGDSVVTDYPGLFRRV
jgi:hypothetical protein